MRLRNEWMKPIAVLFMIATVWLLLPAAALAEEETQPAQPTEPSAQFDMSGLFPRWFRTEIAGIAVWQFIAAFAFILAGLVLKKIADHVVESKLKPLAARTRFTLDEIVVNAAGKPLGYLLLLLGLGGAVGVLPLPAEPNVRGVADGLLRIFIVADVVWFLFGLIDGAVERLSRLAERTESKLDEQMLPLVRKAAKLTIGLISAVWVIQLLGYNVSTIIAGLGIGGLAVALALQDILANFFGSVAIFSDRPFMVGDWIKVDGDVEGIVEQVGFRSTRVRTWPATLVSIPNKTLASASIDNWSRMPKRRIVQTVGVTYETTADQMEAAVAGIRGIIENDPGVHKDFIVVRFTDFADSSLNIQLYYFTSALDYATHTETKERINLVIMRFLAGMGLSIAFPTHTVYFEGDIAERLAAGAPGNRQQHQDAGGSLP